MARFKRTRRVVDRGTAARRRKYGWSKRKSTWGRRKANLSISRWGGPRAAGFPSNRVVRMRYVQNLNFDMGSGGATAVFSATNINDPQVSVGGHQPMGHDQWSALYLNFVVLKAKIRVTIGQNSVAAGNGPVIAFIKLTEAGNAVAASAVNQMIEDGSCTYRIMNSNAGSTPASLSHTYDAKKFWNVKDVKDNQDRLGSTFSAAATPAPTQNANWTIAFQDYNATPEGYQYGAIMVIDYLVLVGGPQVQASS